MRYSIVDDDEHIVELIKLYMDKEGFDTVTANNGKKAVELFNVRGTGYCNS